MLSIYPSCFNTYVCRDVGRYYIFMCHPWDQNHGYAYIHMVASTYSLFTMAILYNIGHSRHYHYFVYTQHSMFMHATFYLYT